MPSSVRIARLPGQQFRPVTGSGDPLNEHAALIGVIRRHLPAVTGSLLAAPRRVADTGEVEWYSDLAGQPTTLGALPAAEQAQARQLLADRVGSVRTLADNLARVDPASAHLADALRNAVRYPGDDNVYVIGGQPVLTFWGHLDPSRPVPAVVADPVPRRAFPWLWLLLALAALAVGALLYWWLVLREPAPPPVVTPPPPDYAALLAAANGDCERLAALDDRLRQLSPAEAAGLETVRSELQRQLAVCRAPDYRALFGEARGDCDRLAVLAGELAAPDVVVTDALAGVRRDIDAALHECRRPDYRALLDAARGDCTALQQLQGQLASPEYPDAPELPAVRDELDAALGACRMQDLQREFDSVKDDCGKLKAFGSKLQAADAELPGYQKLKADMAPRLKECNKPKPAPKPEPPPPPQTSELCPGERPKEQAPDMVLVFDASGSMKYPLIPDEEIRRRVVQRSPFLMLNPQLAEQAIESQFSNMEKRVDVAKQATRRVVAGLPEDVDVGLVLVKNCPQAEKVGFYAPGQRSRLLRDINAITPYRKTPLASGIQVAGSMVDGVNKPSLMVVISDGKETCGADPCAVARQLAARKPLLKINVVDILGTGAGNCVAAATKGRVWTANNASDVASMVDRAASDVQGPAHCRK